MKNSLVSAFLVVSLLAPTFSAFADPPVPETPSAPPATDPAPVVTPLQKYQPAPFTGVLFSPEAVAQVVAEKDSAAEKTELAVKRQKDLDDAQMRYSLDQANSTCKADKSILMAQIDENERRYKVLNEQLQSATSGLGGGAWFGIGTGLGVAATLLTVFVVSRATN